MAVILKLLISITSTFILLSATFVGDFSIFGVYIFYLVWCAAFSFRLLIGSKFSKVELVSQGFLITIILIMMILKTGYYEYYDPALLFMIPLYINVIPILFKVVEEADELVFIFLIVLFNVGLFYYFLEYGRGEFIFGPNISYRVSAFIFSIYLCNQINKMKSFDLSFYGTSILLVITFLGMLSTQSRGSIPIILILSSIYVFIFFRQRPYIITGVMVCSWFFILNVVIQYFSRLTLFDVSADSAGERYDNLLLFIEIIKGYSLSNFLIGFDFFEFFDPYPHNIFVEYILGFGSIFFYTLLFWSVILMRFLKIDVFISGLFPYLIIFLGSQFSGSLYESFCLISLSFYMLFNKLTLLNGRSLPSFAWKP